MAAVTVTGAVQSGHVGITSDDPNNLTGQLFMKGERENTTLQLVGGINAITPVSSVEFTCGQDFAVPDHTVEYDRLEGQIAPAHTNIRRQPTKNVLEIWHEAVAATYTQRGNSQQMTQGAGMVLNGGDSNPVFDEFAFQTAVKMEYITRRLNHKILNQAYQNPANSDQPRRSRGLRAAITTNVVDASTDAGVTPQPIAMKHFDELFEKMINSGAVTDGDEIMLLSNTTQIARINELYSGYNHNSGVPTDRFVGGVRIRTIYTAFGLIHLVLERDLPQGELLYVNFRHVGLKGLYVPGKPGIIFREALGKRGSVDEQQIYAELGTDHGMEWMHGKIVNLVTTR
jgi:hypothetical protein